MKRTYTVVENTPGYLPETDAYETTNRRDAERMASGLARDLREMGYRTTGSARSGFIRADYGDTSSHFLGRVVEILEA
ncbi:MAG: hypothetical protein ACREKR_12085 [Candidatus Methylomirabilales bacterium]